MLIIVLWLLSQIIPYDFSERIKSFTKWTSIIGSIIY